MTPPTPTKVEWYTKEEAGVRLGTSGRPMSTRRVLELAKAGKFDSERFHNPETGQMTIRLHAGSLERYVDERGARKPAPPGMTPAPWTAGDALSKRVSELVELTKLLRNEPFDQNANGNKQALWLTIADAEDYSGLPAAVLVDCIIQGKLPAMDVGRRHGGRWRIRRVDLESFAG